MKSLLQPFHSEDRSTSITGNGFSIYKKPNPNGCALSKSARESRFNREYNVHQAVLRRKEMSTGASFPGV